MQRHNVAFIVSRICVSDGFGNLSSSAFAVMICPFWQKPHCGTCSSIHACCTGWSLPSLDMPSSVVTSLFTLETGVMQDRVATPLTMTVHDPHWPNPQPKRGPRAPISFLKTYSSGVAESTSTVCVLPFTLRVTVLMVGSP